MNTSSRDHLKDILKRFSVRRGLPGQFKLASGRTSEWYVDGKLTTCRAEAMPLIGRAFIDKIEEHGWPVDAVGGLIIGADPIVMAIARESLDTNKVIDAFLVRKEPKKYGTEQVCEGGDVDGRALLIIERRSRSFSIISFIASAIFAGSSARM